MNKMSLNRFFTQIYATMAGGLIVSALTVILMLTFFSSFYTFVASHYAITSLVFLAAEVFIVVQIARNESNISGLSLPLFVIFAILNGITLSVIISMVSISTIILAFVTTSAAFAGLGLISAVIKKDMTQYNKAFMFILLGIIVMSLLNIWLKLPMLSLAITLVSIVVFAFIIVSDNQMIVKRYNAVSSINFNMVVSHALSLYIDFINLFIDIIRLLDRFS